MFFFFKVFKRVKLFLPYLVGKVSTQCAFCAGLRCFTAPTLTWSGSRGTLACTSSDCSTRIRPAEHWTSPGIPSTTSSHTSAVSPRTSATSWRTGGFGTMDCTLKIIWIDSLLMLYPSAPDGMFAKSFGYRALWNPFFPHFFSNLSFFPILIYLSPILLTFSTNFSIRVFLQHSVFFVIHVGFRPQVVFITDLRFQTTLHWQTLHNSITPVAYKSFRNNSALFFSFVAFFANFSSFSRHRFSTHAASVSSHLLLRL